MENLPPGHSRGVHQSQYIAGADAIRRVRYPIMNSRITHHYHSCPQSCYASASIMNIVTSLQPCLNSWFVTDNSACRLGPLFSPLYETYGRRIILDCANVWLSAWQIPYALASDIGSILAACGLAGHWKGISWYVPTKRKHKSRKTTIKAFAYISMSRSIRTGHTRQISSIMPVTITGHLYILVS